MFASSLTELGNFPVAPAEIVENCQQYLCWFFFLFECNQSTCSQGMMLVLPNQHIHEDFPSRINVLFLSTKFDIVHIQRQE